VKNTPTGGTVHTGYVYYDCIGRPARIAAHDLAARAAAAADLQSAASEFATAAGETYGVPVSAVMDAVQAVLDGPAPKAVMDIAKSAVDQVATDLGLPVGRLVTGLSQRGRHPARQRSGRTRASNH
jgi:hypothetical protein